jgi:hypothetical protein
MYKILIKVLLMLGALILFSTRAGAASMNSALITPPQDSFGATPFIRSATSPINNPPHNLPSPAAWSDNNNQSPDLDYPGAFENSHTTIQPLGRLDGIAWNDLTPPRYEDVVSQLLVLPTANDMPGIDPVAGNDANAYSNSQTMSYQLPQETKLAYSLLLYRKADGLLDKPCPDCQILPNDVSFLYYIGAGEQTDQVDGYPSMMVDCAYCHIQTATQISWQIRGVE